MIVWATRDEGPDGPLCAALRRAGLVPLHAPVIKRIAIYDASDEIRQLSNGDWLVLTSAFAVRSVATETDANVAVVGESTRMAAEKAGFKVAMVGRAGSREMFASLGERVERGTVCYARGDKSVVPSSWKAVSLVCPIVYETRPLRFDSRIPDQVDVIAVTSPSAMTCIGVQEKPFASIGATTSDALRTLGSQPWLEAPHPSFDSLADAIRDHSEHHLA